MNENLEEKRIAADILIAAIQQGGMLSGIEATVDIETRADLLASAFRIIFDSVIYNDEDFDDLDDFEALNDFEEDDEFTDDEDFDDR